MSEKKVLAKITERLKHFEEYEQKCAAKLLAMKESYSFDEQVLEIVGSLRRKEYMEKTGDLAVLYMTFIKYSEQVPREKRNEPEYMDRKYWLYIETLSDMEEYPKGLYRPNEYLDREAVFVTAEINEAGEERYSDLFNAKMMTLEYGSEIRFVVPGRNELYGTAAGGCVQQSLNIAASSPFVNSRFLFYLKLFWEMCFMAATPRLLFIGSMAPDFAPGCG